MKSAIAWLLVIAAGCAHGRETGAPISVRATLINQARVEVISATRTLTIASARHITIRDAIHLTARSTHGRMAVTFSLTDPEVERVEVSGLAQRVEIVAGHTSVSVPLPATDVRLDYVITYRGVASGERPMPVLATLDLS